MEPGNKLALRRERCCGILRRDLWFTSSTNGILVTYPDIAVTPGTGVNPPPLHSIYSTLSHLWGLRNIERGGQEP